MDHLPILSALLSLLIMTTPNCKNDNARGRADLPPRRPAQAGRFYPADPVGLGHRLDQMLAQAKSGLNGLPRAIIVPHAGYEYSGPVAAAAYSVFQKLPEQSAAITRVILLAPSHYAYLRGAVVNEAPYQTPLGVYPIDTGAIEALGRQKFPRIENDAASSQEHSDEVQIPFLQKVLPHARLVPLIIGELDAQSAESIARALSAIIDAQTVIVASSDFTHYGPRFNYAPRFPKDTRTGIAGLDRGAIDCILRTSPSEFTNYLDRTGATICGRNPITVLLKIFELNHWPKSDATLLKYLTSGDVTGDWGHSVSYAAIALGTLSSTRAAASETAASDASDTNTTKYLSPQEEKTALKLARFVLQNYIENKISDFSGAKLAGIQLTEAFDRELGVFVTLKKHGNLRGCIGYINGVMPLYQGIIENTKNAAAKDPRFPRVTPAELPELAIEISVMTPLEKVGSIDEIVIGRDGLVLRNGPYSGVFLPQVPVEWHWDLTTYLEQLGLKAGLNRQAYQDPKTELYRFSAQVFGEEQ
ncbi:MAG: AmmeMemoRadiSam system protein B [Firmicutes bacterium]|nr:AmmeMemoRadiSam system protein B [Bacillota bacterium]